MQVERFEVDITTDASGDGTGYTEVFTGRVGAIVYEKDATTPYDNGVDFTVTAEKTTEAIYTGTNVNASTRVAPRLAIHDTTGTALTDQYEPILMAADRVKIVVASGGDTKAGKFYILVG